MPKNITGGRSPTRKSPIKKNIRQTYNFYSFYNP